MAKKTIDLRGMLSAANEDKRRSLLAKNLEQFIRDILALYQEEPIGHDVVFTDIGLDSISAVNLKDLINRSLGGAVTLDSPDIFDHPSINQLSAYIIKKLFGEASGSEGQKEQSDYDQSKLRDDIQEEIGELSKEELVKRLKGRLKDE